MGRTFQLGFPSARLGSAAPNFYRLSPPYHSHESTRSRSVGAQRGASLVETCSCLGGGKGFRVVVDEADELPSTKLFIYRCTS